MCMQQSLHISKRFLFNLFIETSVFNVEKKCQRQSFNSFAPTSSTTRLWMFKSCTDLKFCAEKGMGPSLSQIFVKKWFVMRTTSVNMLGTTKQTPHFEPKNIKPQPCTPDIFKPMKYIYHSLCQPFSTFAPTDSSKTIYSTIESCCARFLSLRNVFANCKIVQITKVKRAICPHYHCFYKHFPTQLVFFYVAFNVGQCVCANEFFSKQRVRSRKRCVRWIFVELRWMQTTM